MDKVDKYSFVFLSNCSQPSAERREMTAKKTPNFKALEAAWSRRSRPSRAAPSGSVRSWEKLNQSEEFVTRKRGSEGFRKEKVRGPVTMFGKPYDLGKFMRGRKEREKK
jgi:hypothetical protein